MSVPRNRIHGVDFSGAQNAGDKIWIASGQVYDGTLRVHACQPAGARFDGAWSRDAALNALRSWIARQAGAAIGLDFPFGLPQPLVSDASWVEWVQTFRRRYSDCARFRSACFAAAGRAELRRQTDRDARTPFSPYNLRLYRQTYYGVARLLAPLVHHDQVCVLPMQPPRRDRPWLLEICPASTLKALGLYRPYKGRDARRRRTRRAILNGLADAADVIVQDRRLKREILGDADGDALDSVIAAAATFRAVSQPVPGAARASPFRVEGHVYV